MVYAISSFDNEKIHSPLQLPLKTDAVFKEERPSKVLVHLHDKVNRILEILKQKEINSPVNKD